MVGGRSPFGLDSAIASAHASIEACVVVGGSLLFDSRVSESLLYAAERGVLVRMLFPSPRTPWLHDLAARAGVNGELYARRVVQSGRHVASAIPNASVRWYEAPGPCWFVLIDRTLLFTKPIDATRPTIPAPELNQAHIDHFGLVFEQLWERSVDDFRQARPQVRGESLVEVVSISPEVIARLAATPADLSTLSPEEFELLVADRLALMGHGVQRVGSTNTRDGGIDLIAWPERNASIPYLLAVQVKHSRKGRTVPSRVVRDLKGVLSMTPLDFGLLVTNTTFSPDARWVARERPNIVRLRDFNDLKYWLREEFAHENLDRDLPSEISLGPGLRVTIPHRRISTPPTDVS